MQMRRFRGIASLAVVIGLGAQVADSSTGPRSNDIVPLRAGLPAPLYNNDESPTSIRHFGLSPDRGLPIASFPSARGELIVGANPKAWRTAYVLRDVNLVFANYFPSWLPTSLYGNDWYYLDDWRANVWPSSSDSVGRRLEVTNGLDFLECTADGAPAGSEYLCPDEPGVQITTVGVQLRVTYPNGTRNIFERENQVAPATTGRYALMWVERKAEGSGNYETIKSYRRNPVTPSGRILSGSKSPEYMIGSITTYESVPSMGAHVRPVSRILLQWKDANAESRDCVTDPAATQCSNTTTDGCYDRICDVKRPISTARSCAAWKCDASGHWASYWFSDAARLSECKQLLCDGSDACWDSGAACEAQRPGSDWKLARMIMPATVQPGSTRPLMYSFYYGGQADPASKFLRLVEDNRGELAGSANLLPVRPSAGNAIVLGYEALRTPSRMLKTVSFEAGRDRDAARFEFTDLGLIHRVWTNHPNAHAFTYTFDETMPSGPTLVTMTDPAGRETVSTFTAIGKRLPTAGRCDAAVGCNIQMGLTKLSPPTGGEVTHAYEGGLTAKSGMLARTVDLDGTVATYDRDESKFGRLRSFTVGCKTETYGYWDTDPSNTASSADEFPLVPTTVKQSTGADETRVERRTICRSGGSCPPYELGNAVAIATTHVGGTTVTETTEFPSPGESKTTIHESGGATILMAHLTGRDPIFGRPTKSASAGTTSDGNATPDVTGSDSAPPADCDPATSYCGGTKTTILSRVTSVETYFPSDVPPVNGGDGGIAEGGAPDGGAGPFDGVLATAFEAAGIKAPSVGEVHSAESTTTSTGANVESGTTNAPAGTVASASRYDANTGNVLDVTETTNGVVTKRSNTWWKAEYANVLGSRLKEHPNALAIAHDTVGSVTVGGSWMRYDEDAPQQPIHTQLGPTSRGHLKADGTQSSADWELLETPMFGAIPKLGCPFYTAPSFDGTRCFSDFDCSCRSRCSSNNGGAGVCIGGTEEDFICRRSLLPDPNVSRELNVNGTSSQHNTAWFSERCVQPKCFSGTAGCDNPTFGGE